jgi:pimeloyl-ACP methyl ester carboxylesterase
MHPVFYILIAVILLILTSGGYVFAVACIRRKELPWLDEEAIKKTSYGQHYATIVLGDRFLKENASQEHQIETDDGLKLYGVWIPAENPKGTILLAHGYRSCKMVDFSLAFEMYHAVGMNILVPDQRAHGKSEGKYITFGVKESRDMLSWVNYHNKTFGDIPLILSGLSMGASTMLYLADADLPENVKGIIADCGFTSPKEIIKSVFLAGNIVFTVYFKTKGSKGIVEVVAHLCDRMKRTTAYLDTRKCKVDLSFYCRSACDEFLLPCLYPFCEEIFYLVGFHAYGFSHFRINASQALQDFLQFALLACQFFTDSFELIHVCRFRNSAESFLADLFQLFKHLLFLLGKFAVFYHSL